MENIRVRIAPSPTGDDLHIGNVYTALINYIFAKKNKGKFIVRIEDTDRTRWVEGSEERILQSLKWFGLDYDEGPDIGGPYGPYRQSERKNVYLKYAEELVKSGHAYYCNCTSERLDEMRKKQIAEKKPTLYDGFCKRNQKSPLRQGYAEQARIKNNKYVIRLNVPAEGVTEFDDLIRGKISFENKLIDDQVLIKSDGFPTYHLAVVVDDYLMKISHVVRAEDWISSTPKHILLYKFLGWDLPLFAHVPLIRNPDKSKLSKRKNPVWASWYKEQGFLPEAILNYLALMGWSMSDEKEIFTLSNMMNYFRIEDLKPVGPAFDIKKLEWMNGLYLRELGIKDLESKIKEFIGKKYDDQIVAESIPIIRERIKKLSDYLPLAGALFEKPVSYEMDLSENKELIGKMIITLEKLADWKAEAIGNNLQELCKITGIKAGEFFMILRVAVTGKKTSPPLNESMEILGKEEVIERLSKLI
jgi:glutamyl-tRNA synthetase